MAKNNFQKLCNNLSFLYFVYALVLINIMTYIYLNRWNNILLFLILVLVFQCLTKNMCVLLLMSLLISNIFLSNTVLFEGLTSENSVNTDAKKINTKKKNQLDKHLDKAKSQHKYMINKIKSNPKKHQVVKAMQDPRVKNKIKKIKTTKKKNIKDFDNQIDYSKTYHGAMKHLQGILKHEGLEGLTSETKKLIDTQKQLSANINQLEPWLKNASGMFKELDLGNIASSLTNFNGMFNKK